MPTRFRTSFTKVAGLDPTSTLYGRIINSNLNNWTVDVNTQFDRKRYYGIQISSPYLHYAMGEGFFAFPELGARVMVTVPGDSSPPFVSGYVMPVEAVNSATADAPQGTQAHGQATQTASDASFAGGRSGLQPGDLGMVCRDGNSVILHRGGVLSLGATPLSQRMYIPLNNLITDFSQNYEHHNSAGAVLWGVQVGPSSMGSTAQVPSLFTQTFRVFANDAAADIRICSGSVVPIPEPDGGVAMSQAGVGQSGDGPIIYEVTVSPTGFVADSGQPLNASTGPSSVFKFVFDRKGNTLLRMSGNVSLQVSQNLYAAIGGNMQVGVTGNAQISSMQGLDLDGGTYAHMQGSTVRLGQGVAPVARQGDIVSTSLLAAPILLTVSTTPVPGTPTPCTIQTLAPFAGTISSGNPNVLA